MKTFSMTDKGKTRRMNQDFVFTSEKPVGNLPNLFIVADGMGGHNAGDYASRYAVEMIVEKVSKSEEKEPVDILLNAVKSANQELVAKASQEARLRGMGTTAVIATLDQERLWVANVGDSRLYLLNDEMKQITRDHSLVEEMVRRGELKRREARSHPDRNIITRALGAGTDVNADVFEVDIKAGDQILMCSDGLTSMVEDEEIFSILKESKDISKRVEKLVKCANLNGGRDNITVIVIEPFSGEVTIC